MNYYPIIDQHNNRQILDNKVLELALSYNTDTVKTNELGFEV